MSFETILFVGTALLALGGLAFGEGNPFSCVDPNDCLGAALDDLSDFDLLDILDLAQIPFIFLGDLLEFVGSMRGLVGEPLDVFLQLVFGGGWLVYIVRLML